MRPFCMNHKERRKGDAQSSESHSAIHFLVFGSMVYATLESLRIFLEL
jgi:hypothetical protein